MGISIQTWRSLSAGSREKLLRRPAIDQDATIRSAAAEILANVRAGGDKILGDLTRRYDNAEITEFRVSAEEIEYATRQLTSEQLAAIDLAIHNVTKFHEQQLPQSLSVETMPGVVCERISHAIDSVGLYVPAGTAPLPSAAIMLAVPAAIAACPRSILCTPPRPDGRADSAVLVAATRANVTEIYKVGGAQAIAAMAYGTESIPKVCKIFGQGCHFDDRRTLYVGVVPVHRK